jgi:hypothetical protein
VQNKGVATVHGIGETGATTRMRNGSRSTLDVIQRRESASAPVAVVDEAAEDDAVVLDGERRIGDATTLLFVTQQLQ